MDQSLTAGFPSEPGHRHEHFSQSNLNGSGFCRTLIEAAAPKGWSGLEVSKTDQDVSDTQVSHAISFKVSNNLLLNLDRVLPDTQRNYPSSQTLSRNVAPKVRQLDGIWPDTQENTLEHQDTQVIPTFETGSRLEDTQQNVLTCIQTSENMHGYLNQFVPDSPTQVIDREDSSRAATIRSNAQLPDTQRSECQRTGTILGIDGDQNPPDTKSNSSQLVSPVLPPTTLPMPSQDLLLPDKQRDQNKPEASFPPPNTFLRLSQIENDFTDTQISLADNPELPNLADLPFLNPGIDLSPPKLSNRKEPLNKATCRERKRIVVSSNRPPCLTRAMCQWVDSTNYLLDPFRDDDECWFHPSPPPGHLSMNGILRPCGKLQKKFNWKDRNGKHSLVLNFGIASKLVNHKMTKQQKDGFINKQWHLSHLCGNWTCLNPTHTTVEPGNINISRNNCFSHRSGCLHNPPCMKDKKVALGADGQQVDHTTSFASNIKPLNIADWEDWSAQGFNDGEDFTMVDDNENLEFAADENGGESFVIIDDEEDKL
ncbi:hypothetical protein NA56DRAFT_378357 [Hyaloscypha hepaticicola]|uniref:Zinc-binding loop region of homing endonuclease domain-containing protein n=1 Tax=Hyaloscypha hepaticicola TaxID=2082293 RepID=A0A2J6PKA7_9HELO|nr:hypothetical protein NA56DRAFT_378357 [Hyaloscypha hepaticicola]